MPWHFFGNLVFAAWLFSVNIAQKMKFSIKDFFNECGQIRTHLLKKTLMENVIFLQC